MSHFFVFIEITGMVEGYTNKTQARSRISISLKHNAMSPTNHANIQIKWFIFHQHTVTIHAYQCSV